MGAEVLKISAPNKEDLVLAGGPGVFREDGSWISANRAWLMHGKGERLLNLKSEEGVAEVKRLILEEGYNCIVEQFRPGTMERLGLGYEDIKSLAPDIIYASLSGYGQTGPYSNRAGHDINYLSLSGVISYSGRIEEGPTLYGLQIADIVSAQNTVIGILAGHARRLAAKSGAPTGEGRGCHIDISILDGVVPMNAMAGVGALMSGRDPEREGDWLNGGSCYDFYETADGQYMSVGALEPKFWQNFCLAMGHEDWIEAGCVCADFREKKQILRAEFKKRTRGEWTALFQKTDACVEPVLSVTEALHSENARARGWLIEQNGIEHYDLPIRFSS